MSAYSTLVLGDGPRGYWRLGESGFPYNDSSGNGAGFAAGQFGGTLAPGQTSLLNSDPADLSMGFPTGWLSRATVAALNVGDVFSLEAWVKLNTLTNPNMAIYCHWTSSLYLRLNSANKLELVQLGVKVICASTVAITNLNTHHVVATKNGATVKLYLDGVDVTGSISNFTFSTAPTWMAIGAPSSGSEYANMTMDEVAIYPVALSQAQVLAHYNAGTAVGSSPQTVPVGSVSSAQAFGGSTVTREANYIALEAGGHILLEDVPGALLMELQPGTVVVVPGVPSAQSFGVPALSALKPKVGSVPSAQMFGSVGWTTRVTRTVTGVPSAQAFGSVKIVQTVHVQGVLPYQDEVISITGQVISGDGHLVGFRGGTRSQFGNVTIKTGPVWVPVAGVPSAQAFGSTASGFRVFNVWMRESACSDLDLAELACLDLELAELAPISLDLVGV